MDVASIESIHFTLAMPSQPGTSSRSGKPCCGGNGYAVDLVAQQYVVLRVHHVVDRQAALEILHFRPIRSALDALVKAGEQDFHRVVKHPGVLEHPTQRRTRPLGRPDRVVVPRNVRPEAPLLARAAVAATFHRGRDRDLWTTAEVVHVQGQLVLDQTRDRDLIRRLIDLGNVVVD